MMRIKVGLIVVGCVLTYLGYQEWRLAGKAKDAAQTLTCNKLIENGCGDNANVRVTGAVVLTRYVVYKGHSDKGPWTTVWAPIVPADGPYIRLVMSLQEKGEISPDRLPVPTDIRLVLKTDKVSNPRGLDAVAAGRNFDGMVINEIEKLSGEERSLLEKGFPGTDFSRCYILEHGRTPASQRKQIALLIGGLAAGALGVFWLVVGLIRGRPATLATTSAGVSPAAISPAPLTPPANLGEDKPNPYAQDKQ